MAGPDEEFGVWSLTLLGHPIEMVCVLTFQKEIATWAGNAVHPVVLWFGHDSCPSSISVILQVSLPWLLLTDPRL